DADLDQHGERRVGRVERRGQLAAKLRDEVPETGIAEQRTASRRCGIVARDVADSVDERVVGSDELVDRRPRAVPVVGDGEARLLAHGIGGPKLDGNAFERGVDAVAGALYRDTVDEHA